jgi:hypothetical protein
LAHRLQARSSHVLYVALHSNSERSGWRFEVAVHADEVYIKATTKHSIAVL